jgi:iron(III) transport system ATP-binding protein
MASPTSDGRDPDAPILEVSRLVKAYDGPRARRNRHPRASTETEALSLAERKKGGAAQPAVADVSFALAQGEMFTLLGPSGCGKTTTLRCIAGLETPDSGAITVGGRTLFDGASRVNVPPHDRRLGMVFQSYAIWPHMTVSKNVSFPLEVLPRRFRPAKAEVDSRVASALRATELDTFTNRSATALSGGQQQRLALARGLVINPQLMLLDEPLSNLDAKLRDSMRFELKRLQKEFGITVVYVTHDQTEALTLSSRIAVMNKGRIVQVGRPRDIYEHPNSRFVADFVGVTTFLDGTVSDTGPDGATINVPGFGPVRVAPGAAAVKGRSVSASIRPEWVVLSETPPQASVNKWQGVVANRAFIGESVEHMVRIGDVELRNRSNPGQTIPEGTRVWVSVDPARVATVPFDDMANESATAETEYGEQTA